MARIRYSFSTKLSDDDAVGGAVLVERLGAQKPALIRHDAVCNCEPDVQERWGFYIQEMTINTLDTAKFLVQFA